MSELDIAWKTGTSNNNCDAWCFAYTPDYTLGVWFGNKSGQRAEDLVGAVAAVPVVREMFDYLYASRPQTPWSQEESCLEYRSLCAETGLTPSLFCQTTNRQLAIPGLPLKTCEHCAQPVENKLKIISPAPNDYQAAFGKKSVILNLRIDRKEKILWYLNDQYIGTNLQEYEFPCGKRYRLRAIVETTENDHSLLSTEIIFSVK